MPVVQVAAGGDRSPVYGFQQVTVSNTVVALIIPAGEQPSRCVLTINTNDVRYRLDGQDPTTAIGFTAATTGRLLEIFGYSQMVAFRMIRSGSVDAEVSYAFEG